MSTPTVYTMEQVISLRPEVQTLLQKWVLQPVAERLTLNFANQGNISPRHVTLMSATCGSFAALGFILNMNWVAMLSFVISICLDLVDGKLARLTESGTAFGIMLDAYSDIYRVIVAAVAIIITQDQTVISGLMLTFVSLHFGEFLINQDIYRVAQLWKSTSVPAMTPLGASLLVLSKKLKKYGLKLISLHYQERLFIVFGLGAVTGNWTRFLMTAILITLLDLYLKYHFDLALLKQRLNPEEKEVLDA